MNSVTCPRCGTINPADAMNCRTCRINLNFARQNPNVAKGIAPPEPQVVQEFIPSKLRYFLWMASWLILGTLIVMSIDYVSLGRVSSNWLSGFFAAAVLLTVQALATFRNYKVVIMEDSLSGPSVSRTDTISFKFEQIDMNKMERRSILERMEGSRSVYSTDGKRIIVSGLVYDQDQIRAMLSSIGYKQGN